MRSARPIPIPAPLDAIDRWIAGGSAPARAVFLDAGFAPPYDSRLGADLYEARWPFITRYGFSIPCAEAVDALAALGPLVELGAGTAYWSAILAARGVDVVATDLNKPGAVSGYAQLTGVYHPVRRLSAAMAVKLHPERAAFASWPCYQVGWMADALTVVRSGIRVAIIHEGEGGCIGTDEMFYRIGRTFTVEGQVAIPQWPGLHDRLTIWRKR